MTTADEIQWKFPREGYPVLYEDSFPMQTRVNQPDKGERHPMGLEFIIQSTPQGHFVRQFRDGEPVYQAYHEDGKIKVRHTGVRENYFCLCKINEEVRYGNPANHYWIVTAREDMEAIRQGIQEKPDLYQ